MRLRAAVADAARMRVRVVAQRRVDRAVEHQRGGRKARRVARVEHGQLVVELVPFLGRTGVSSTGSSTGLRSIP